MRRSPRLTPLALLVFLALALALAACGGGGSGQDADKLLSDTFASDDPVTSGRLALKIDVRAEGIRGLPSPLSVDVGGPFQSGDGQVPKFDFHIKLATRDGKVSVGTISTGKRSWAVIGDRAYTLPQGAFGSLIGNAKSQAGVSLKSLGVDPRRWLRDVRDEGTVSLGGAQVVHLSAGVKVPSLLTDLDRLLGSAGRLGAGAGGLSGAIDANRKGPLAKAVKAAHVDIWTGQKDHRLRRLVVDLELETPGPKDGSMRLDIAIADLNRRQAIGPPANPRPLAELTAGLAELARRALNNADKQADSGAAAAPAAPATPAAPAAPASGSTYEQCITAAGTDLAKAQQCASLLDG